MAASSNVRLTHLMSDRTAQCQTCSPRISCECRYLYETASTTFVRWQNHFSERVISLSCSPFWLWMHHACTNLRNLQAPEDTFNVICTMYVGTRLFYILLVSISNTFLFNPPSHSSLAPVISSNFLQDPHCISCSRVGCFRNAQAALIR